MGACIAIALLSWSISVAVVESRRSSFLLAERRADAAAHLLLEGIVRDMRGVQTNVLPQPIWSGTSGIRPHEFSTLAATTFARYPYPESLFAWQADINDSRMLFFNRADRPPPWASTDASVIPGLFPVVIDEDAESGHSIYRRILEDAERGSLYSAFGLDIGGMDYQIVAEITYADEFREQPSRIIGFTVNLSWARDFYFPELTRQVAEISAEETGELSLAVFDGFGRLVVGDARSSDGPLTKRYQFPLAFFDPAVMAPGVPALGSNRPWTVEVSAEDDPTLAHAMQVSTGTLVVTLSATAALVIGLGLSVRADRARTRLAEVRAEFVAGVTHELKTPIASIRAAAETLRRRRVTDERAVTDYADLIVTEATRLSRLVDNVLFHARIADVTDFYTFGPIDLAQLFDDILAEFSAQLDEAGFAVDVGIPADLPPVVGDELSLRLVFGNLVDNAIKYSGAQRWVGLAARADSGWVSVEVRDRGVGIPADEISVVLQKFSRGRHSPHGGSGLGLAIANRIVADHGGAMTISSRLGSGTTVTVTLAIADTR